MPPTSWEQLGRALARGERGGCFFLYGDEEQLKDEAAAFLIDAHLDPATRDFNLDELRAADTALETIASTIQTPPMMAEFRVVVVRETQALVGSTAGRALLDSIVERPLPGLALILLASIPQGSRAATYDRLKKGARSVEFPALSEADLPGWLMERARHAGVELEPAAAQALAAARGNGVGSLLQDLRKLREYVGDRGRITREDVAAAVMPVLRQNRWEWFDAVAECRFSEARAGLAVLLESGESGVGLVLGLGTHFLRLALVVDGGASAAEGALPPHQRWLARRLAAQARHWSAAALRAALDDLLRADRLLKSTPLTDRQIVEELLLRLQATSTARPAA